MKVRNPEPPVPDELPAPPTGTYFDAPVYLTQGAEGRLVRELGDAARWLDASKNLTDAIVAAHEDRFGLAPPGHATARADLLVTGRRGFAAFAARRPAEGGPEEAAAMATLAARGRPDVNPASVRRAATTVLDRAYRVAAFLRGSTDRGDLRWIAVSGEDDLPHRPVNVPRTRFPQHDLDVSVVGDLGPVAVRTRFAIATAADPAPLGPSVPTRSLPVEPEPRLPVNDRLILFINGSDSRLEEADSIIPALVRQPDGRPTGYAVIAMDLPGAGYVNVIPHTAVGAWPPPPFTLSAPYTNVTPASFPLMNFLERFVVAFVAALSARLGRPGLVESRLAAVIGGSLGGNLSLRLARRPGWVPNAVAWSPGSVWRAQPLNAPPFPDQNAFIVATNSLVGSTGEAETGNSRDQFFAAVFDRKIAIGGGRLVTQPEQWYRKGYPWLRLLADGARRDRRETYTPQFRDWHWRTSLEEIVWTWRDIPAVHDFRSRLLLGAGAGDNFWPANIYDNTRTLAPQLAAVSGDTFFFDDTGHSVHAERPMLLASRILAFLAESPGVRRPFDVLPAVSLLLHPRVRKVRPPH
jgi:hypothetical protein